MAIPQYRIFFDASAYIAGLVLPKGAAGELIRLVEAGILRMVVSQEVIIEADRVVVLKFPELVQENRKLLKNLTPEIAPDPTRNQAKLFLERLPRADALILWSARQPKVSAFVTWSTNDFMGTHISSNIKHQTAI